MDAVAEGEAPRLSGRGYFSASYMHLGDDGTVIQGGETANLKTVGAGGSFAAAFGALQLQGDFESEETLALKSADDTAQTLYGGGLHVSWRDPGLGSLGIFGAVGKVKINDEDGNDPESVVWGVGLEGQAYFESTTVYMQSGFLDREPASSGGDPDALRNAGFVRAVGRYFWSDDFELEGELSFAQGTMDEDVDKVWLVGWRAELEYRLAGTPVSGFARYSGARYQQADDHDVIVSNRISLGLRIYFGHESLKADDRRGVSLDLPPYLEWNGQIAGALE